LSASKAATLATPVWAQIVIGKEARAMRKTSLFWIVGGVILASSGTANAQVAPGGGVAGAPAGPAVGTVNSRDVTAANRERDAALNRLAGDGVKITDRDREKAKPKKRASAVPATAADITAGAQIRDVKGVVVGKIATLAENEVVADAGQIVIDTGQTKIGVPLSAFGKDDKGLMLSITAEKFNELVAQVRAKAPAPEPQTD
jgi:hypothetical protein